MRRFTLLKSLFLAAVLAVGSGSVWAETITLDFSFSSMGDDGWAAAYGNHTVDMDDATVEFTGGSKQNSTVTDVPVLRDANHAVEVVLKDFSKSITAVTFVMKEWSSSKKPAFDLQVSQDGTQFSKVNDATWSSYKLSAVNLPEGTVAVKAVMTASGKQQVGVASCELAVEAASAETVAIPTFTITGDAATKIDTYYNKAVIALETATDGATIYYTDDDSEPSASSIQYSTPFEITETKTIKAIAIKGGSQSSIASRTITIVAPATAELPYTEGFDESLGDWYAYNAAGNAAWESASYNDRNYAYINGYNQGANEDWLISPAMISETGLSLAFESAKNFTGNDLQLKYSTNYKGYGNPTEATWTDITDQCQWSTGGYAWVEANCVINTTAATHIAFVYTCEADAAAGWEIDNLSVKAATAGPVIVSTTETIPAFDTKVGNTATQQFNVSGHNLKADITLAISGTDAALFSVEPVTIAQVDGEVAATAVTVSYAPTAEGTHTATLTISSTDAELLVYTLNGTATPMPVMPDVIITEVYGGGGNNGASYNADFVELYNTTASDVNIGGWGVQYYSATGTSASTIAFPENTIIKANDYFLIQMNEAGENGEALPTPNFIYTSSVAESPYSGGVNLSGTNGKVALYTTTADQDLDGTDNLAVITGNEYFKDYVVFGTGAPAMGGTLTGLGNDKSATRKQVEGAFVYTQDMANDFEAVTPTPQAGEPGTGTGITPLEANGLYVANGTIYFNAAAGERVEVINTLGQCVYAGATVDGLNSVAVEAGIVVVKVGNSVGKVVVK